VAHFPAQSRENEHSSNSRFPAQFVLKYLNDAQT